MFADVEGVVSSVEQNEVVPPEEGQSPDVGGGTEQGEEVLTPTPANQFEFDGKGTITKYIGSDEVVVIPDPIGDVKVTNIGNMAFAKNTNIKKVVLNEGLENIGASAFQACSLLKEVEFKTNLKEIGNMAFALTVIENLTLPEGLTTIGEKAFYNAKKLKKVDFVDSLQEIKTAAFSGCTLLEGEIKFGPNLKYVGKDAFKKCNIDKINYNIDSQGNKLLLHENIFLNKKTLNLPKDREIVIFTTSRGAISGNIEISLGEIDVNSADKSELNRILKEKIKIYYAQDAGKEIGIVENDGIDWNLDNLIGNKVTINGKFKEVPNYPESNATRELYTIKVTLNFKKSNNEWTSKDFTSGECAYTATDGQYFGITGLTDSGKEKLEKTKRIEIPKYIENTDGSKKLVEGIGKEAFKNMGIEGITFPSDLDCKKDFVIDAGAFLGNNISSLNIPNYVKFIDSEAFKGNKLTSLYIPASVLRIGNASFQGNEISKLEFSDDVELIQIDNYSFSGNRIKEVHLPYSIFKLLGEVFKIRKIETKLMIEKFLYIQEIQNI